MPLGNASDSSSANRRRVNPLGEHPEPSVWLIPIGRWGHTHFFLSAWVLIASAFVLVLVAAITGQNGNADLPMLGLIGVAIWLSGWLAQVVASLALTRVLKIRCDSITLNLLGPEWVPRGWSARQTLVVGAGSLSALLFCGAVYWWADGGFRTPTFTLSGGQGSPGSADLWSSETIWRVGAWLCWAQAVCQVFPLPRSTGRQVLAAITSICSRGFEPRQTVAIFRACLVATAMLTALLAIWIMASGMGTPILRWPLLLVIAVWLGVSSGGVDVAASIASFYGDRPNTYHPGDDQPDLPDGVDSETQTDRPKTAARGLFAGVLEAMRARQDHRRVQQALESERREAVDAARMDEILQKLHRSGPESLTAEDRLVLERVSQSIRQQRSQSATKSDHSVSDDSDDASTGR